MYISKKETWWKQPSVPKVQKLNKGAIFTSDSMQKRDIQFLGTFSSTKDELVEFKGEQFFNTKQVAY